MYGEETQLTVAGMSVAMKKPIAKANMASLIRTERSVSDLRGKMMVQMVMHRQRIDATPCTRVRGLGQERFRRRWRR
jgi:hypothetical protein